MEVWDLPGNTGLPHLSRGFSQTNGMARGDTGDMFLKEALLV